MDKEYKVAFIKVLIALDFRGLSLWEHWSTTVSLVDKLIYGKLFTEIVVYDTVILKIDHLQVVI